MDLLDRFRIDAENQMLRYAVSKAMFCSVAGCGRILDYRKAVMVEFRSGNYFLMCEDCFNTAVIQTILQSSVAEKCVVKIVKYQDWAKMEAEEAKREAIEKQQLKLDLFNTVSKN